MAIENPAPDQAGDGLGVQSRELFGKDGRAVVDPDRVRTGNARERGQDSKVPAMPAGMTATRPGRQDGDARLRVAELAIATPGSFGEEDDDAPLLEPPEGFLQALPRSPRAGSGTRPRSG